MAVLDRVKEALSQEPRVDVTKRLERGRARHRTWLSHWAEQVAFYEGRQFVWRTSRGNLSERRVELDSKPEHRARTVRNRIFKVVNAEVSAGTQRVPGYEVIPSTTDPEDVEAAGLSEKVLLGLFEHITVRKRVARTYRHAVMNGEGFLRPHWNPDVGKRLPGEDGTVLYEGEIAVEAYGPQDVFWEPGVEFDKSDWHAVEHVMTPERVRRLPGFIGGELRPDAISHGSLVGSQLSKRSAQADTVQVTEYLELPSGSNPAGRRFYTANGKPITAPESYPYVLEGPEGSEPCLLKLSYIETPERDRDMGLVEHLIDAQRTVNDCINKQIEWKNLALNPQLVTGPSGLIDPLTNEPGAVFRLRGGDPSQVQWRQVPSIPPELDGMIERAVEDINEIAAQRSVPSQVESGKAIAALIEQDDSVRAHIVQSLADFHSKLGKHLLALVQRYYSEQRLMRVNGRIGSAHLAFRGADLRGQIDVRVLPGSIEPRTRLAVEQKVLAFADRQWISPEQAMAAINGGTAENLVQSYELDQARAHRIIRKITEGPDTVLTIPDRPDGTPGWMPRSFDNIVVHKTVFEDWMKTLDYDQSPPEAQEVANLYYDGLLQLEAEQAQREAEMQSLQAEEQGMQNAARLQGAKPMPDMASNGGDPDGPV